MENSSQEERETPTFFCHLCSVSCASALNLQSHFLGIKHRKVEEAIRIHVTDKVKEEEEEVVPTDKNPKVTLQEHIDACKDSEPALGLEYVYQYKRFDYHTYECKLCECRAGLTHMFMHIVGAKHRITYLGKHHPELGICGPYIMRGPKKLKKLRDVCLKVEKEFGRKNLNIMDAIDSQWACNPDAAVSSVNYTPYNKVEKVDFTSDDFFDSGDKSAEAAEDKPVATKHVVTFLELKAAYEASQKNAISSDNIEHNSEAQEEDTENKEDDTDEERKNDSPEKEEHNQEPCKSDQGFRSSKELFSFLEHFSIVEEGDAKFVNTVVEMLTFALVRHRKGSKEKKLVPAPSNLPAQVPAPSNLPAQVPAPSNLPAQVPAPSNLPAQVPTPSNLPAQVPAPSNKDPVNQSKTQPIPKAAARTKLKFTVSSNKAQDTPETQNQSPAAYQYDNRKPTSEPQASSSLVSVQTVSYSATQVNIGAPFAQTRFPPPHAPFPSRPPLFPIAKDDALSKFFESIKNMDVNEVATTLSRITATNPAFKGINVPSLIRYLTETGKLKTTQSMQQMNQ